MQARRDRTMSSHKERVEFKLMAPQAQQVFLSGSFNNWSAESDPMKRDKNGLWKKTRNLPLDTYEYKFIVDGVWTLDPDCPDTVVNPFGTINSVVHVQPGSESTSKKEKLVEKLRAKLSKWNMEIDKLEAKADQAGSDAKTIYRKQVLLLQAMRKDFEDKLEELRTSEAQAWVELKGGVENAWKALSAGLKSAKSKLKK